MSDDAGRAQDQGRPHRRRRQPSAETSTLLAEYQEAMRTELRAVLTELHGRVPPGGLVPLADGEAAPGVVRPSLGDRMKLWDLAIKLGRELGTEVDPRPPAPRPGEAPNVLPMRARRGRVEFGPD